MKKAFITTSIPYVNASPHIGFALEIIQADTLSRYYKNLGYKVFFLTGTDENAIKNAQKAEELGITVQQLVDEKSKDFYALKDLLNLDFDYFIRTTSQIHKQGAQKFWQLCKKDIYKKTYEGLYCIGCESFYKDSEFEGNICPYHEKPLEKVKEENYFFALSKYQDKLIKIYEQNKIKIIPEFRKDEVLNFIKQGLEDFSISRPAQRTRGWGIDVPADPSQKIYVWFDALVNYLTGISFSKNSQTFKEFWLENNNKIHIIGKDIIKFHLIYWPAMLLSAGLPLPNKIFIHGFLTLNKKKISKTLGNIISPREVVQLYGKDATRYYFLREIPSYGDGDFSHQRMKEIYNSELANELGNLILRITTLAAKDNIFCQEDTTPFEKIMPKQFYKYMENFQIHLAVELINKQIKTLNKEVDQFEPWNKTTQERKDFLIKTLQKLNRLGKILKVFMPDAGEKIINHTAGKIEKAKPLFPKLKA